MSKEKPDHHDAELVIKLYELRREAVMRESRNAINFHFMPKTFDEFKAVTQIDHPLNAAFRQMASYWEMVYGMARHEIVHAEYLVENNGEGMNLYSKVEPFLKRFRDEMGSPYAFQNAEWAATQTAAGRRMAELMKRRFQAMQSAK